MVPLAADRVDREVVRRALDGRRNLPLGEVERLFVLGLSCVGHDDSFSLQWAVGSEQYAMTNSCCQLPTAHCPLYIKSSMAESGSNPLAWIDAELAALEVADLRRRRVTRDGRQGTVVTVDGRALVNFASNDYLGLAGDPRLAQAAEKASQEAGWGAAPAHSSAAIPSGTNAWKPAWQSSSKRKRHCSSQPASRPIWGRSVPWPDAAMPSSATS